MWKHVLTVYRKIISPRDVVVAFLSTRHVCLTFLFYSFRCCCVSHIPYSTVSIYILWIPLSPIGCANFSYLTFINRNYHYKMFKQAIVSALLVSTGLVDCRSLLHVNHVHHLHRRQNEDANGLTLLQSALQSASAADGSVDGVSAPGQSKSAISTSNFINFCEGKTITNGLQVQGGSCNGIRK